MSDDDFGGDLLQAVGDGCMYGLFDALGWKWSLGILAVIVVIWLLVGHPGIG